jgi:hypothetical protein
MWITIFGDRVDALFDGDVFNPNQTINSLVNQVIDMGHSHIQVFRNKGLGKLIIDIAIKEDEIQFKRWDLNTPFNRLEQIT